MMTRAQALEVLNNPSGKTIAQLQAAMKAIRRTLFIVPG